jgi:hypothetical protein
VFCVKILEHREHLVVGQLPVAPRQHCPCSFEALRVDNCRKRADRTDPTEIFAACHSGPEFNEAALPYGGALDGRPVHGSRPKDAPHP